jgi:hypothetical protein
MLPVTPTAELGMLSAALPGLRSVTWKVRATLLWNGPLNPTL